MNKTFYPEPIWALYLTKQQIEDGAWVTIDVAEIKDYSVNPLAEGWEARYAQSAIDKLTAVGMPRLNGLGANK